MEENRRNVIIVGAGFGGIATALALSCSNRRDVRITLITDKPHFEYHSGLYRVVTGKSPLEVCVPLAEIFGATNVSVVIDAIRAVLPEQNAIRGVGGATYRYDHLVLALGSQTAYFNIQGLEQFSFGFKSINEALRLKRHLHELFAQCARPDVTADERVAMLHFAVVGAGASGVELAGELAAYTALLAREHAVAQDLVTIDLIEGAPRILPAFSERFSARVAARLRELGVNIYVNRTMLQGRISEIALRGMTMKTETVIWTAGIKPNELYQRIPGFSFDQKGRVVVDEFLRAHGTENVFVIGDGAATPFTGMAQTAIDNGRAAAENIIRALIAAPLARYVPKKPYYALPVGQKWAAAIAGSLIIYGRLGWFIRRAADLRYFLSILPLRKALIAFTSGKKLCESCPVCEPAHT